MSHHDIKAESANGSAYLEKTYILNGENHDQTNPEAT
jgi:hypothetical protein